MKKAIEDLELESLQYEAIQEIQDELNDKRNSGKVKLEKADLIEQDHIDFGQKMFQLKNKEEVNDFRKRVIENIIGLRGPYSHLNELITKGERAWKDKNDKVIRDVLGALDIYRETTNDKGKKAYEQRVGVINSLRGKLTQQAQQVQN